MTIRPLRILTSLALLVPACTGDDQPADSDADVGADADDADESTPEEDVPEVDPGAQVGGLDDEFRDAAEEFGVPSSVARASVPEIEVKEIVPSSGMPSVPPSVPPGPQAADGEPSARK